MFFWNIQQISSIQSYVILLSDNRAGPQKQRDWGGLQPPQILETFDLLKTETNNKKVGNSKKWKEEIYQVS